VFLINYVYQNFKTCFFFFFLPNGLFFYSCYLNDLFNLDIFNIKKIDELDSKIRNLRTENHLIISKDIDKNESNSNNVLIYIITGCFIVGFFYLGYNFFNNSPTDASRIMDNNTTKVGKIIIDNSTEVGKRVINNSTAVGKIVMENSFSNSQSLVKEISGASKLILDGQETLKAILTNSTAIENVVVSSTEVTNSLVTSENSFIRELLIKMEESAINSFKTLNSYINQNVEMKLINIHKKINILQNSIDKLISVYDFSSPEKIRPDISPYFEEEGRSLDRKISIENNKSTPVKLDAKKLIFDEK
jgi:hypothetical protein